MKKQRKENGKNHDLYLINDGQSFNVPKNEVPKTYHQCHQLMTSNRINITAILYGWYTCSNLMCSMAKLT